MPYSLPTGLGGPRPDEHPQPLLYKIAAYLAGVISGSVGFLVRGTVSMATITDDADVLKFRTTALTNTAQAVKASGGNVLGITVINPNTAKAFVKFCNVAAGSVLVGTTAVSHVLEIPANDGTNDGQLIISPTAFPQYNFSTAIAVYAVTTLADAGATAPSTSLYCEIQYI